MNDLKLSALKGQQRMIARALNLGEDGMIDTGRRVGSDNPRKVWRYPTFDEIRQAIDLLEMKIRDAQKARS